MIGKLATATRRRMSRMCRPDGTRAIPLQWASFAAANGRFTRGLSELEGSLVVTPDRAADAATRRDVTIATDTAERRALDAAPRP